jgi:hypothetical protein
MDVVVVADKVEALKKKRMGPPGPCSSRSGSRYSMSRTCGPRDIISLVIPRLGDNMLKYCNCKEYSIIIDVLFIRSIPFCGLIMSGIVNDQIPFCGLVKP